MNTDPRFYNTKGQLTAYALACGYKEHKESHGIVCQLWYEGCYHVRAHDHEEGRRVFWDSFNTLSEARALYGKFTPRR